MQKMPADKAGRLWLISTLVERSVDSRDRVELVPPVMFPYSSHPHTSKREEGEDDITGIIDQLSSHTSIQIGKKGRRIEQNKSQKY